MAAEEPDNEQSAFISVVDIVQSWRRRSTITSGARRRIATVRRLLIARAARLTTTARHTRLRFAPAANELIAATLARIHAFRRSPVA